MPNHELEVKHCIVEAVQLRFNAYEDAFDPTYSYAPTEVVLTLTPVDKYNFEKHLSGAAPQKTSPSNSEELCQLVFQLDVLEDYSNLCDLASEKFKVEHPGELCGHQIGSSFIRDVSLMFRKDSVVLQPGLPYPPINFVINLSDEPVAKSSGSSDDNGIKQNDADFYKNHITWDLCLDEPKEYRDFCNIGLKLLHESDPENFIGHEVTLVLIKQEKPYGNIPAAIGNKEGSHFVVHNCYMDNEVISSLAVDPFTKEQAEIILRNHITV